MARIHFVSIGGSVMHNLAIAIKRMGHHVTGSDDEIYDPSKTKLKNAGLLPRAIGWDTNKITSDIDYVLLGMHAKKDNPELLKALELDIPIFSYPQFIAEQAKGKKRIVIAGSHGKTTTTGMIMHVLKGTDIDFDYLIGASIPGFDDLIKLSDAPLMIIEGDEYLSSAIDSSPKFLHYKPHLAVLTGIAWDHINVFPDFNGYVEQFKFFLETIEPNGYCVYDSLDNEVNKLIDRVKLPGIELKPYIPFWHNKDGHIIFSGKQYEFKVFGQHNYANAKAAFLICKKLGISEAQILDRLSNYKGAHKRMQKKKSKAGINVYMDFAHAPSKVNASTNAIRSKHPDDKILAVLELHTYSSLNKSFIPQYRNTLKSADNAVVYINKKTLEIKNMDPVDEIFLKKSLGREDLDCVFSAKELEEVLQYQIPRNNTILIMSSGNLGGISLDPLLNRN